MGFLILYIQTNVIDNTKQLGDAKLQRDVM